MARRTHTHPVAVVVFVIAEGVDDRDAIHVATSAVTQKLTTGGGGSLDITTRAGLRRVDLAQVAELGDALRAGQIGLSTSSAAYRP